MGTSRHRLRPKGSSFNPLGLPLILLFALTYSTSATIDWTSISTPPRFVRENHQKTVYFTVEKTVNDEKIPDNLRELTISCLAEGNPKPIYKWRKNRKPFELSMFTDKVVQKPGEGTLVFSKLDAEDAGEYTCEAQNDNGTAVSVPVKLEQTWIRHFVDADPEEVRVELGDPYARNCSPPASNPGARVYWILMGSEPGQFETINSTHISSNEQGTIFFHYVKESDLKQDRYYTCTAENTELKDYKFGSKFRLEITNNKRRSLTNVPPTEQYVNQSSPIALQGNQHKLHCFFSGYPAPHPKWFHNGVEISENNDDGFRFESYGKTLVFNVTQDKAGKYDCRFPMHSDIDRVFNVQVEAAPYWPDGPPPNTNTSEGETVVFDCTTSGKPTPVVTFYKNGVEMKSKNNEEKWLVENNKLTIYDVKKGIHGKGDNAVYQCKAENKHGYVWTNFYLNLLAFKPQLLADAGEVEAVAGQSVTLECKFFASPNAAIKWESPVLKGIAHDVVPANPHGVGKLVIKSVTPEAEGEYECIGSNKYGQARGGAKLLVRKATKLDPFPKTDEIRVAGEEIRLPCEAQVDERLEVRYEWTIDGRPIPEMHMQSGHYKIDEATHALIVENPSQYDSAKYQCAAITKLDRVEKTVQIQIKDVPVPIHAAYVKKCDPTAQSAEIHFEHMEAADTVSPVKEFWVQYQMDADTEGAQWRTHPVPTKAANNEIIEGDNRIVRGSTTVALQPFGNYVFRVLARNAVGDSSPTKVRDGCVTPAKLPDRNPIGVGAEGASPDNLVVSWKPMPREEWNGPNFHYKIRYRPSDGAGGSWKEEDVADPFADRYTINLDDDKDAKPFQPYEVQVMAVNDQGPAAVNPETAEGRTGEGVPSSIVEGFRVVSKKGTSATFAWNPVDPLSANGNFTGYKITYWFEDSDEDYDSVDAEEVHSSRRFKRSVRARRGADDSSENGLRRKTIHFGPKVTQGTVTDLKPDTVNYATIAVTNGKNEGEPSDAISFRTEEGVPSPVRGLTAYPMNSRNPEEKGVVVVQWKSPRQKNGKIGKYVIEYCRTEGGRVHSRDCPKQEVDPTKKELRLTGLENETPYRFVVRAETGAGEGDPNSFDAKTLPEVVAAGVVPETPHVKTEKIGDDHFNLTFAPGNFNEQERRPVGSDYKIQVKEDGSDEWKTVEPKDENSLRTTVDGLKPGTKYEVRSVAAYRDPATGDEQEGHSQSIFVTTRGTAPRSTSTAIPPVTIEIATTQVPENAPTSARMWLILVILFIILLIFIICCIICVAARHRGENYPVSQKEREQGREPILPKQSFNEYKDDDEKRSLTGSKAESETDSMAEYGDTDPGRFTEDGSFIGQYVPQKTLIPPTEPAKGSTSTFV